MEAQARGDAAGALALWQSAAADCRRAIELDPAEFAAHFDLGNIDMRLGDYGAALRDFRTAADLAPGLAGALVARAGRAAGHAGVGLVAARPAVAGAPASCLPAAPPPHPGPPAGYRLREATLMFQQGDAAGARRTMQGVARKNGAYSEAHACLAAVLWSQVGRRRSRAALGAALAAAGLPGEGRAGGPRPSTASSGNPQPPASFLSAGRGRAGRGAAGSRPGAGRALGQPGVGARQHALAARAGRGVQPVLGHPGRGVIEQQTATTSHDRRRPHSGASPLAPPRPCPWVPLLRHMLLSTHMLFDIHERQRVRAC